MTDERRIRVLIAKPGLDGHDRGAKVMALGLRDAGFEVIFTGIRQSPDQIAEAALQEDVEVVGLSCLSGAHRTLFRRTVEALRERSCDDVLVIGGGVIPEEDIPYLKEHGVQEVFPAGTLISTVAEYIKQNLPAAGGKAASP